MRRSTYILSLALAALSRQPATLAAQSTTLIRNVLLLDGTGGTARQDAVRIAGDRIAEVQAKHVTIADRRIEQADRNGRSTGL